MIILGLDPGIGRTGFGVIDTNSSPRFIRCGCITTPAIFSVEDRLHQLGQDLHHLLVEFRPERAVVEQIFFGKNRQTAILTAQARGVLLYVLREHHVTVESLTPLQIKSRLTGYGAATKTQIQSVVRQQLNLDRIPEPDDAADALAAALCLA